MNEFEKTNQQWVQEELESYERRNYVIENGNEDTENNDKNINSSWSIEHFSSEESGEDEVPVVQQRQYSNSHIFVTKQRAGSDYLVSCDCNQKFKKLEKKFKQIENNLETLEHKRRRTREDLDKLKREVERLEFSTRTYFGMLWGNSNE